MSNLNNRFPLNNHRFRGSIGDSGLGGDGCGVFCCACPVRKTDDGEFFRLVGEDTEFNRVTLMDIYTDDDRVDEALDALQSE